MGTLSPNLPRISTASFSVRTLDSIPTTHPRQVQEVRSFILWLNNAGTWWEKRMMGRNRALLAEVLDATGRGEVLYERDGRDRVFVCRLGRAWTSPSSLRLCQVAYSLARLCVENEMRVIAHGCA